MREPDCDCLAWGIPWPMCHDCEGTGYLDHAVDPDVPDRAPVWLTFAKRRVAEAFGPPRSIDEVKRRKFAYYILGALELDDIPLPAVTIEDGPRAIWLGWFEGAFWVKFEIHEINGKWSSIKVHATIPADQADRLEQSQLHSASLINGLRKLINILYARKYQYKEQDVIREWCS